MPGSYPLPADPIHRRGHHAGALPGGGFAAAGAVNSSGVPVGASTTTVELIPVTS